MKLLIVSTGTDIAGCGIALKRAFDKHSDWEAWHVRRGRSVFDYPADRSWSELPALWRRADVVHVMDDPRILRRMPRRRRVVVQYLGSRYLTDPEGMSAVCRQFGAREAMGGFYLPNPQGAPWLPVTADLDGLSSIRAMRQLSTGKRSGHRGIRIAHAPTNRALKSTAIIEGALKSLGVDYDIVEGVTNRECLARKAASDIFVDELTYGYGLNAIEAWAMGLPVVSGMTEGRRAFLAAFGETPWEDATQDTLTEVLRRLIDDPEHRAAVAQRGQAFMQRYHSPRAVVERCLELYA